MSLNRALAAALAEAYRLDTQGRSANADTRARWAKLLEQAGAGKATPEGFALGMAGSALAATRWTDEQVAAVDRAILRAAAGANRFTADDVWAELGDGIPVTKGLAGRLMAAAHRGAIVRTLDTVTSTREGVHGHGQRLAVWVGVRAEDAAQA